MSALIVNHIEDIVYDIDARMDEYVRNNMTKVKSSEIGLDSRCGTCYINDECIIVLGASGLDYYGGFEYIDREYRKVIGHYTIYFGGTSRVDDCIDYWQNGDYTDDE